MELSKILIRGYCQIRNIVIDLIYFQKILRKNNYSTRKYNSPHSTDYLILDEIFNNLMLKDNDFLLDVGSGYGRVLLYARKKINKINLIGCEADEIVYENSIKYLEKEGIEVFFKNILELKCSVDYIFMFNPLSASDLKKFLYGAANGQYGDQPTIIYLGNENFTTIENTNPKEIKKYKFEKLFNKIRGGEYAIFKY